MLFPFQNTNVDTVLADNIAYDSPPLVLQFDELQVISSQVSLWVSKTVNVQSGRQLVEGRTHFLHIDSIIMIIDSICVGFPHPNEIHEHWYFPDLLDWEAEPAAAETSNGFQKRTVLARSSSGALCCSASCRPAIENG